jgi:hypothetical protein
MGNDGGHTGPNWQAFGRILAIGRLRNMGIEPTPAEVLRREERREDDGQSRLHRPHGPADKQRRDAARQALEPAQGGV